MTALYTILGIIAGYHLGKLDDCKSESMVFPWLKLCASVLVIVLVAVIELAICQR